MDIGFVWFIRVVMVNMAIRIIIASVVIDVINIIVFIILIL